jgi:hypothetical protein
MPAKPLFLGDITFLLTPFIVACVLTGNGVPWTSQKHLPAAQEKP